MKQTRKQITADINETTTLKDLMASYEEIAAVRMQRIREQVLKSRDFHQILSHYFHEIRTSQSLFADKPAKKLEPKQTTPLVVLFSDSKGLYGDILHRTTVAFIEYAREHSDAKLVVIGTLDEEHLKEALPARDLTFFPVPQITDSIENIAELTSLLSSYQEVTVFHGKFISLINQEPQASQITGIEEEQTESEGLVKAYLLEPSQEQLKEFFQKEIITLLFDQAILEGTLAKVASRVTSLEKATSEASRRLKRLERLSRMVASEKQNKEQITYLAGLSLWKIQ